MTPPSAVARQQVILPLLMVAVSALVAAGVTAWRSSSPPAWAALVVALFALGIVVGLIVRRPSQPVFAVSPGLAAIVGTSLFLLGTLAAWAVDFRNDDFFATGWPVVLYNAWRLLLLLFFIAIFRGAGCGIRRSMERRFATALADDRFERLAVDCIIGAAIWIVAMYVAGVLGLYWRPLALVAAAVACALGIRETANDLLQPEPSSAGTGKRWSDITAAGLYCLVAVLIAALVVRLALGGLADEYDSSHYLPYYEQVSRNHDTSLNDYWYHFWITKGAGLQFMAVLVGDVFSPALVSFALLLLTACFVACFVRRCLPGDVTLSLAAVVLFVSPFLVEFHYQQKQHFVGMALIVAAVWIASWLCRPGQASLKPGLAVLALLSGTAVLCGVPFAAPLSLWLGVFGIGLAAVAWRSRSLARLLAAAWFPLAVTLAVALLVLGLNTAWVGMAEASPFKLFFDNADQSRLARHISPYLVLFIEEASSETTGRLTWESLSHPDWAAIAHLLHLGYLHLSALAMLALLGVAAVALMVRRVRERLGWPVFCLFSALISAGLLTILVSQPGSLFRAYLFTLPLAVIALFVTVTAIVEALAGRIAGVRTVLPALLATMLAVHYLVFSGLEFSAKKGADQFAHSVRFVTGQESLATAIKTLATCEKMASTLAKGPTETKVWSLTFLLPVGCYLLPQPRILMEVSAAMGPHWHRIVFGSEDVALQELNRLGINHFYVDLAEYDLAAGHESTSLMGCLAYSPLFSPQSLKQNFRVVWRDRDAFLLATARAAPDAMPVPDEFLQRWPGKRDKVQFGLGDIGGLCRRVAEYHAKQGEHWPVKADRALPRIKGWQ